MPTSLSALSLNIYAGRYFEELTDFLSREAQGVDVFCLQEVTSSPRPLSFGEGFRADSFELIQEVLRGSHAGYFFGAQDNFRLDGEPADFPIDNGLAIFVRRVLSVVGHDHEFVYGWRNSKHAPGAPPTAPRNLAWVQVGLDAGLLSVFNLHGLWNGQGKGDSLERLSQSLAVRKTIARVGGMSERGFPLLCGDFNLNPDTRSLSVLEKGMRNLIKDYGVTNTRTPLYRNWKEGEPMFADYMLVGDSPALRVDDFMVLPDAVSDHAPLRARLGLG